MNTKNPLKCLSCGNLYTCDNNYDENRIEECTDKRRVTGDHDVATIVNTLEQEEYYDKRPWHTPLLKDEDDGEFYVIREIYIDEDDDIIFKIQHL